MPELVDTSVWGRKHLPRLAEWLGPLLLVNEIGTTDVIKLELLHTARSDREFRQLRQELDSLPQALVGPAEWTRALDVMEALARRGGSLHRSAKPADFIIAAAGEAVGWTIVHYDQDFDQIRRVTGQPMRWAVPRGSLPY